MLFEIAAIVLNLMPWPSKLETGAGKFAIDSGFRIDVRGARDARVDAAAARVTARLAHMTGATFVAAKPGATLVLEANAPGPPLPKLGEDESYTLEVTAAQARISAPATTGLLRGLETFVQLVQPSGDGFAVPALRIEDRPRYPWRGLMLDVARHFMPLDVVKRTLDGMAAVKLNVFHWHLSDDQGFRIESKRFPKLHELGSDGLYFTQGQVREVIAYAAERGIRVVPEFDMPGHTTAWFVGYPELASGPGPYAIERGWGIFDPAMDPTREETYQFLDAFIGEMAELFPDEYFHIGGDEVNGKQWDRNPRIKDFMRSKEMKNDADLQAYFSRRVIAIVTAHGKKPVGWDEILAPGLPKEAVIQSWRGQKSLAAAAQQGHSGILSNGYYLDLMHSTASHYAVDPRGGAAAGLSPELKQRILGGEGCMWAEFVKPETVDSRIWPRMAAIAERLWSPEQTKDLESMYARMHAIGAQLEWLGLRHRANYEPMLARLTAGRDVARLRVLADVVEPVKDYNRPASRRYTQQTPLIRLVDAARPESEAARQFSAAVDAYLKGDRARAAWIRDRLETWRDNHARLAPLLTDLLAEAAPLSEDLSAVAAAGLAALDGKGDAAANQALFKRARQPRAELLLMVVPPIERLAAKR